MDASNPPGKVPPEENDAVKRAPQDSLSSLAKRLRQDTTGPAVLTESPQERNDTPPPSPSSATGILPEVPPAPPSTPASVVDTALVEPPMDLGIVQNASALEQQQRQLLEEQVATPAPTKSTRAAAAFHKDENDFSDWSVGKRYHLLRMLGRGSYGQVAQAKDNVTGKFVAIKRITSAFEQEVDAIRLYREMHILRRLRGHECIIGLLDVVQPPSDDINDFHELYLVFECTYSTEGSDGTGRRSEACRADDTIIVISWNLSCYLFFFVDVDTDLYKLIMSPQYLTTEHIQTFLYQMLAGLNYIHSSSVIHRDLVRTTRGR